MSKIIIRLIKGFVIGASMLIPGVSGGTMAIILGIYDELIHAVSNIRKAFRAHGLLLLNYALGGTAGIVALSGPLLKLVTWRPVPCMCFFMGAIVASIPSLFGRVIHPQAPDAAEIRMGGMVIKGMKHRPVGRERLRVTSLLAAVLGLAIAVGLYYLPENLFGASDQLTPASALILVVAGFIIAIALVLPGISGSYMLLVFGMYNLALQAVQQVNLLFLAPLAVGVAAGTFGTAKLLDRLMERHPQFIFMLIIGFMLGSLYDIFPGLPSGAEIPISIGTFAAGFAIIFLLVSFQGKKKEI